MNKYVHITSGLIKHKYYVFIAGRKLKVGLWQLLIHDLDKLLPSEFFGYANGFSNQHLETLDEAWLKHQNRSKHHWEYWILRSTHRKGTQNRVLNMPEKYVREMIADWMGAERIYSGTWDITKFLNSQLQHMTLSISTRDLVIRILKEHGIYEYS